MSFEIFDINNISMKEEKNKIKSLNPLQFENYIAELFSDLGFSVYQTPQTNDGGKDIILEKKNKKYYVECKHFSDSSIGREIIQKLVGAGTIDGDIDGYIIATSSYFNANAIECAKKSGKILLLDLDDILHLKNYLNNLDSTFKNYKNNLVTELRLSNNSILKIDLKINKNNNFFICFNEIINDAIVNRIIIPEDKSQQLINSINNIPNMLRLFKQYNNSYSPKTSNSLKNKTMHQNKSFFSDITSFNSSKEMSSYNKILDKNFIKK